MAAHLDAGTPAFGDLVPGDAILEHVAAGFVITEGRVWMGTHHLFRHIPCSRTVGWQMSPGGTEFRTFRTAPSAPIPGVTTVWRATAWTASCTVSRGRLA